MKKKTLKTETQNPKVNRSRVASLLTFDIPVLIEKLRNEQNSKQKEYNAMVLLDRPERQIVLTILHEGTKINSFQSNNLMTFQIIEGALKFNTRKESVNLDKGQLLTLYEKVKYSLITKKETVFLLTIANET